MKRLIYGSFFLICMALIGYSKYSYIQDQHLEAQGIFGQLKSQVQGDPRDGDNQEKIKAALEKHPDSVYMLLQDPLTQSGWGYVNATSFEYGAHPIEQKLHAEGSVATFDWVTKMGAKSKFVEASVFQWPEQTMNVYYGYLSPKHPFVWNTRQQVAQIGFYIWLVVGSLLSFLYFFSSASAWRGSRVGESAMDDLVSDESVEKEIMEQIYAKASKQAQLQDDFSDTEVTAPLESKPKSKSKPKPKSKSRSQRQPSEANQPVEVIELPEVAKTDKPSSSPEPQYMEAPEELEDPIVAMLTDDLEDDTSIDDIPKQIWLRLLDEPNTHEWEVKGNLYVRETKKGIQAILFPWGTSMVTRRETIFPTYLYELEGRVMSGEEGFVVLFQAGEHALTWVLGGWRNTRCEVVGYESTKTTHPIEPKKWHHVRIEKDKNEIIGYIDGRTAWQLPLAEITHSSPDLGFAQGMGIGVWSTSTKFRNIRVLKL